MDEGLQENVLARLRELRYLIDDVLYANYTTVTWFKELDDIDRIIAEVESL